MSRSWRLAACLFMAALCLVLSSQGSLGADEEFRLGVAHIKKREYPQAIKNLGICLKKNPRDYRAYYFLGICYENAGDLKNATTMFSRAMQFGYKTSVYDKACTHLQRVNPSAYVSAVAAAQGTNSASSASSSSSASARPAASRPSASPSSNPGTVTSASAASRAASGVSQKSYDNLPPEARIHYQTKPGSDHQFIDASVNGRRITMFFDTGAEGCVFGATHLKQLGIQPPKGPPIGYSSGVGAGGAQATWVMRVDLKVGPIEKKNFLISYVPPFSGEPLLGQTFFADFHYTIDSAGKTIHFVRNDRSGVRQSIGSIYAGGNSNRSEVPFRNEGKEIIVDVEVNGRKLPMYFDTGASCVLLGASHLRQLGITVPGNARAGISHGVQGVSTILVFPIRSIRMGPIEHHDFDVAVDPSATIPHPLLGQSFFKDYRYSIDNVNKVIKFTRLR